MDASSLMYTNEILLFVMALISTVFVLLAWRLDKVRLYGVIVLFLVLISITGGKVVEFFGHETNAGNIFYGSVVLATYFLIERYGRREGYRSILKGVVSVVFFSTLARLAVAFTGSDATAQFNAALSEALSPSMRIAIASLVAYACSQSLNVYLYCHLREHMTHLSLWLRANTANLFSQIVDSLIFFTIAFWGVVRPENLVDIVLTGLTIKVVFVALVTPLLYLNGFEEDDGKEYTSITWK